jgi:hypothetical protein
MGVVVVDVENKSIAAEPMGVTAGIPESEERITHVAFLCRQRDIRDQALNICREGAARNPITFIR